MLIVFLGFLGTKAEWKALQALEWVRYYQGSQNYLRTAWCQRVKSLRHFLSPLSVTLSQTKQLLVEAEREVLGHNNEEEVLEQRVVLGQELEQGEEIMQDLVQEAGIEKEVEQVAGVCEEPVEEQGEDQGNRQEAMEVDNEGTEVKLSRSELFYNVRKCMQKSDIELFVECISVPEDIRKNIVFRKRQNLFIKHYLADKSTEELLNIQYEIPPVVLESKEYKRKIKTVSIKERSRRVVMDSLGETVVELKKNPTKQNKNIVKIIAAASSSVR